MIYLQSTSERYGRPRREVLGEQDLEVLRMMSDGHTKTSIAVAMGVSEASICHWLRRVRREMKARTDVQMVSIAIKSGIIQ